MKKSSTKKTKKKLKLKQNSLLGKIVLVTILTFVILTIFRYAGYFKREKEGILKVIIQGDVDPELAHEVYIDENEIVYFSEADMKKYFDNRLYYEKDSNNKKRYFSICQNKSLEITEDEFFMNVNGVYTKIRGKVFEKDGIMYFPISEFENIYNIEVDYLPDSKRLNIDRLSEKKSIAVVKREIDLKYKMSDISRTITKLEIGEIVTIIDEMNGGKWVRVKTNDFQVGYVKKVKLSEFQNVREDLSLESQYFQQFDVNNDIIITLDNNIYDNFEQKIQDYDSRKELCKEISNIVVKNIAESELGNRNIGLKMDISNLENKDNYYKLLEELKVLLNSNGCFLIVTYYDGLDKGKLGDVSNLVV